VSKIRRISGEFHVIHADLVSSAIAGTEIGLFAGGSSPVRMRSAREHPWGVKWAVLAADAALED
jgi:hypothetical protein